MPAKEYDFLFGQHPKLAYKQRVTGPSAPENQKHWLDILIAELEEVQL